jgi:hypothetical protein
MLRKIMITLLYIILSIIIIYGLFWLTSFKKYKVDWGISFSHSHARDLGLDWKEVYDSMLTDLKPKYIRISAMWDDIEHKKGELDYSKVDWMLDLASVNGTKVTLVIGQKAPRWPECYVPNWATKLPDGEYEEVLMGFIEKTVERYKTNDAVEIWQVENEPFIRFHFGECENYNEKYVEKEIELVSRLDSRRPIMITDSGEIGTWYKASKLSDKFGTTLYRVIRNPKGKVFSYAWFPPAFYKLRAKIFGVSYENFYVSELQAEPWFSNESVTSTPKSVMEETLDLNKLQKNMEYSQKVGASRVYLWGVEWWYFMREVHGDGDYWEAVKEGI